VSWQIDLFRVAPGQDPRKVRDMQYEWEEHEGYALDDVRSDATDRWIERVIELLESVAPGLKIVDENDAPVVSFDHHGHVQHVRIWQPEGPLIANVYPHAVDLRVNLGHAESHPGEYFEVLWRACVGLAEQAECAVFPQYDDDPVDTTLELEQARAVYDDWA
jgi:hypothetical protein